MNSGMWILTFNETPYYRLLWINEAVELEIGPYYKRVLTPDGDCMYTRGDCMSWNKSCFVSYHNVGGRPLSLERTLAEMRDYDRCAGITIKSIKPFERKK